MTFKSSFTSIPGLTPAHPGLDHPTTPVTRTGDDADNDLKGGFSNDSLFGNGGDDVLEGLWGDDVLYGGEGQDGLFGGSGDDTLYGDDDGETHDVLSGGSGNDEIYAGSGDLVLGDAGDDVIITKGFKANLRGGEGDDTLMSFGRDSDDLGRNNNLSGGNGDDTLIMIGGVAEATGGEGDDTFIFVGIEDGGFFSAVDREGANDYHFWNANQERLSVNIEGFTADDSLHFHGLFDGITTLDSNGDGFITDADDFVFLGNNRALTIMTDNLQVTVGNHDWLTSDENWLAADQVEIA